MVHLLVDSHDGPVAVLAMVFAHNVDPCVAVVVGGIHPLHARLGSLFEVSWSAACLCIIMKDMDLERRNHEYVSGAFV